MPRGDYSGFYEELELPPDAQPAAIKTAFRRLVKSVHPDITPDPEATERYHRLQTAYDVLKNPERRLQYDIASRAMDEQADLEQREAAEAPPKERVVYEAAERVVERERGQRQQPEEAPEEALSSEPDFVWWRSPSLVRSAAVFVVLIVLGGAIPIGWLFTNDNAGEAKRVQGAPAIEIGKTPKLYAVVVGNGKYDSADQLRQAPVDAAEVARLLGDMGYGVTELIDGTLTEMEATFAYVLTQTPPDSTIVVYYAGHGIQVDGKNYLIPTDASLNDPFALASELVDVDYAVGLLAQEGRRVIALLDTCRDRSIVDELLASYPKLAGYIQLGTVASSLGTGEVFFGFATSPGTPAKDSIPGYALGPFAQALSENLTDVTLDVDDLLQRVSARVYGLTDGQQRPWKQSSLREELSIAGMAAQDDRQ
jgi:hypothetical protein